MNKVNIIMTDAQCPMVTLFRRVNITEGKNEDDLSASSVVGNIRYQFCECMKEKHCEINVIFRRQPVPS